VAAGAGVLGKRAPPKEQRSVKDLPRNGKGGGKATTAGGGSERGGGQRGGFKKRVAPSSGFRKGHRLDI